MTGSVPTGAVLAGTGEALPARVVETHDLATSLFPDRDAEALSRRVGIVRRHWLGEDEDAAGLAARALQAAMAQAGETSLDRLILCSSTGGDHLIPATACDVAAVLGLDGACDAFDLSNSCSGFLTGLDVAAASVKAGARAVGVVAVETFSRDLSPRDRRAMMVLGDGAAAAVVRAAPGGGLVARHLRWSRRLHGQMTMPVPRAGGRSWHAFDAPTDALVASARDLMGAAIAEVLAEAGLTYADLAHVVVHQPNGEMVDEVVRGLGVPAHLLTPVVAEVGSLGCASTAVGLHRALRRRPCRPGDHVLLASVGAGTSYGALLWRWPPLPLEHP